MLQSLKHPPRWLAQVAQMPHSVAAGMRFRLQAWASLPARPPHPHVIDGLKEDDDAFRRLSFTFAVIALSARVACADGPLTREKYIAFRESFPLHGGICGTIRSLFLLACRNDTPPEHYVHQIKYLYPSQPELFRSVVERLSRIAAAAGGIGRRAEFFLADIAHGLDLTAAEYAEILHLHDRPAHARHVLGVTAGVKSAALKKRYHELMRRYHPDRYGTEELSDELRLLLRSRTSEINAAYKILSRRAA